MTDEEKDYYAVLATHLKSHSYSDALNTIQDDLNLSAQKSYAEMEALLIFMVNKTYAGKQNVDIALMALGLLSGFSNREERSETSQERDAYAERRERFLRETNYIAIKSNGKFNTYEDASKTVRNVRKDGVVQTELDTIRSTLDTATSRCLAKVISSLYGKKGSVNDYLDAAKAAIEKSARDKNIERINWSEERVSEKLLPTMKCFKILALESPEPSPPSEPPEPKKLKPEDLLLGILAHIFLIAPRWKYIDAISKFLMRIAIVVIAICMVINIFKKDALPSAEPPQQNINVDVSIQGENITLDQDALSTQIHGAISKLLG